MLSLSLAFLWYLQLRRPGRGRVTSWGAQADWFRSCNYAGMRYGLPLYWAPTGSVAWISTDIPLHHIPIYQEFRYNMNCQSFQNTKSQLLIWFRVQSSGKTEPARQQNAQKQRPSVCIRPNTVFSRLRHNFHRKMTVRSVKQHHRCHSLSQCYTYVLSKWLYLTTIHTKLALLKSQTAGQKSKTHNHIYQKQTQICDTSKLFAKKWTLWHFMTSFEEQTSASTICIAHSQRTDMKPFRLRTHDSLDRGGNGGYSINKCWSKVAT